MVRSALPPLLDEAIRHARRAVALAPQQRQYKEHLAISLTAAQQYAAAIDALRDVDGGRHLLARLLADSQAIPLPDNAIPWPQDNVLFVQLGMAGTSYPLARVRTYLIPHPAAHVEAFYRRHWPGFSWFRQDQDLVFTQFLRLQRGVLRPTAHGLESIPEHPASGLLLSLLESHEPTPLDGPHFPLPAGQTYCRLWILNYRLATIP